MTGRAVVTVSAALRTLTLILADLDARSPSENHNLVRGGIARPAKLSPARHIVTNWATRTQREWLEVKHSLEIHRVAGAIAQSTGTDGFLPAASVDALPIDATSALPSNTSLEGFTAPCASLAGWCSTANPNWPVWKSEACHIIHE